MSKRVISIERANPQERVKSQKRTIVAKRVTADERTNPAERVKGVEEYHAQRTSHQSRESQD